MKKRFLNEIFLYANVDILWINFYNILFLQDIDC